MPKHLFVYKVRTQPSANSPSGRAKRNGRLTLGTALTMIGAIALAGCATTAKDLKDPPIPDRPAPSQQAEQAPLSPSSGIERPSLSESVDPIGALTLTQAIALTIERSPSLQAHAWGSQSATARVRQARLWPNPELEAERENFEGTGQFSGSASAETTISLAQALPLGGDIRRRRQLAELHADLADWDYHAARLEALLDVTQRFVSALTADRRLKLAQQELELAQTTERITATRVDAGDASPIELSRVVVPVVTAELALAQAERLRDAAYQRLALSWGSRSATFDRVSGDLAEIVPPPDPQSLTGLINETPAVARWATEISARIAERRFAQAQAIPDLTARIGRKSDRNSGDEALVVGISLPLPVFDRKQGDILAARMSERAAMSRKRAAELRIESLLSAAYADLASAYDEATALRERALPAAEKAYPATRQAFEEGELPFLDVLDAQRTFFELQKRYVSALADYHATTAELESLVGAGLTGLSN